MRSDQQTKRSFLQEAAVDPHIQAATHLYRPGTDEAKRLESLMFSLINHVFIFSSGEIPWSKNLYVQSKSTTAFDVVTVCHVFYFGPLAH